MPEPSMSAQVARLLQAHLLPDIEALDVMGPTIQFLVEDDNAPCVMRGTIPPGVVIPLHSHADPEIFTQVSGEVEALMQTAEGFDWVRSVRATCSMSPAMSVMPSAMSRGSRR